MDDLINTLPKWKDLLVRGKYKRPGDLIMKITTGSETSESGIIDRFDRFANNKNPHLSKIRNKTKGAKISMRKKKEDFDVKALFHDYSIYIECDIYGLCLYLSTKTIPEYLFGMDRKINPDRLCTNVHALVNLATEIQKYLPRTSKTIYLRGVDTFNLKLMKRVSLLIAHRLYKLMLEYYNDGITDTAGFGFYITSDKGQLF